MRSVRFSIIASALARATVLSSAEKPACWCSNLYLELTFEFAVRFNPFFNTLECSLSIPEYATKCSLFAEPNLSMVSTIPPEIDAFLKLSRQTFFFFDPIIITFITPYNPSHKAHEYLMS